MIEINKIKKTISENQILKIENLIFDYGKVYALIGKNGSGKTSLAKVISKIDKNVVQEIKYDFEYENDPKEKISVILQNEDTSFDFFSMNDYIEFYKDLYSISDEYISDLIDKFKLGDKLNDKIKNLSPGIKKVFEIFLLIINDPKVLILDEFTSNLDISYRESLQPFLFEAFKDRIVIIITHDPNELKMYADEFVHIHNGVNVASYDKKYVEKNHNDDYEDFLLEVLRGKNV